MAITSVSQEYEFTKSQYDYKTDIGTTYGGKGIPIDIRKVRENFDKDKRPKCFNYNTYRYIAKKYQKLKKE